MTTTPDHATDDVGSRGFGILTAKRHAVVALSTHPDTLF